jgi:hypothetical protein
MWNKILYHTKGIYYSHRSKKIAQLTIKSMSNLLTHSSSLAAAGCADLFATSIFVGESLGRGLMVVVASTSWIPIVGPANLTGAGFLSKGGAELEFFSLDVVLVTSPLTIFFSSLSCFFSTILFCCIDGAVTSRTGTPQGLLEAGPEAVIGADVVDSVFTDPSSAIPGWASLWSTLLGWRPAAPGEFEIALAVLLTKPAGVGAPSSGRVLTRGRFLFGAANMTIRM